jgi:hypothetical protein
MKIKDAADPSGKKPTKKPEAYKPKADEYQPKPKQKSWTGEEGSKVPINWMKLKTQWMAKNLDPGADSPYQLVQLAKDTGINYAHLCDVAWKNGWKKELKEQAAIVAKATMDKLVENASENEGQIRLRQAEIARIAQGKAREALLMIDPSTLEPRDIIKLAALGLIEERKALGFPDRVEFDDLSKPKTDDYESPMEKAANAKALNQLADKLRKKIGTASEEEEG